MSSCLYNHSEWDSSILGSTWDVKGFPWKGRTFRNKAQEVPENGVIFFKVGDSFNSCASGHLLTLLSFKDILNSMMGMLEFDRY